MKIRKMDLIHQEHKYQHVIRLIGGLIGLSLCFNFVRLEYGLLINLFGVLAAFVFWGIGVNIIAYSLSNLLSLLITQTTKEKIYRAIIIGHVPLILAFLTAKGVEIIEMRIPFLIGMEAISIIVSIALLYSVKENNNISKIHTSVNDLTAWRDDAIKRRS